MPLKLNKHMFNKILKNITNLIIMSIEFNQIALNQMGQQFIRSHPARDFLEIFFYF